LRRPRQQGGFTLAEMLIALAVSALLVSLVYSALRIGMRSWEASQQRVDQVDSMRIGWQFLHQALSGARPISDPLSQDREPLFKGEKDRLVFAADMPSYLGLGGLYVIELLREQQGQQQRLLLRRTLLSEYRQHDLEVRPQQAVLVDELRDVDIAYFGRPAADDLLDWHPAWEGNSALPSLIRIDVQYADGSRWPTLVAHPRLGQRTQVDTLDATEDEIDREEILEDAAEEAL